MPSSRGSSQPRDQTQLILYHLSHQGSREYWSGQPIPSLGHLPDPGIELGSPPLQEDSLPSEPPGKVKTYLHSS